MNPGFLIVITAPSGAGKTTLISALRQEFPELGFSVSTTTRSPRPGEVDGRDYHFVEDAVFSRMVEEGAFIEWAAIHGNRYGTSWEAVDQAMKAGRKILLDIDVQGARSIRAQLGEKANHVFIAPPSLGELERRLSGRGTESVESLALRLHNARAEMQACSEFDFIVVNDDLQVAISELRNVYLACHYRPLYRAELVNPGMDTHEN